MSFSNYTTRELEFIISNFDDLKRELEERNIKESNGFPFKTGDVVRSKHGNDNFLFKINKIDKRNNSIIADEIIIRDDGLFNSYIEEWFDIDEFYDYVKIEDTKMFENLLNIIYKCIDDEKQLKNDTYKKLKKEIETYDYNV